MDPVGVSNEWRKSKGDGPAQPPAWQPDPPGVDRNTPPGNQTNDRIVGEISRMMIKKRTAVPEDIEADIRTEYPNMSDAEVREYASRAAQYLRRQYEGGNREIKSMIDGQAYSRDELRASNRAQLNRELGTDTNPRGRNQELYGRAMQMRQNGASFEEVERELGREGGWNQVRDRVRYTDKFDGEDSTPPKTPTRTTVTEYSKTPFRWR